MSKLSSRSWWLSLGLGKQTDDGDDFGDMGTAFGLDASMAGPDGAETTAPGVLEAEVPTPAHDRINRRSSF